MHIVLVISSVGRGGAEKVLATMANWWAEQGNQVSVVVLDHGEISYSLHPSVTIHPLNLLSASSSLWEAVRDNGRRIVSLRRTVRALHPDVVMSFMDGVNTLAAIALTGMAPLIVTEHAEPGETKGGIWRLLRLAAYPLAARVVVQTPEAMDYFPWYIKGKSLQLFNPIESIPVKPAGRTEKIVMGMGRFSEEKRFDFLIRCFARASEGTGWRLMLVGDGPERDHLEALSGTLSVRESVIFTGWLEDPYTALAKGRIIASTSRSEGFGNALVEGMGLGLPAIATDCPHGPRYIIRNGVDGVLVDMDDEACFTSLLRRLMRDDEFREGLAARAPEALDRFSRDRIMPVWDKLLHEVAACR